MILLCCLIVMLTTLSGCIQPLREFGTEAPFEKIKKTTRKNIAVNYTLKSTPPLVPGQISSLPSAPLSLDQATAFALEHNPRLQAMLKQLGIAQADLVQAGLFTNPELSSLFRFPHRTADDMNIELDAPLINLADMWRVPLAKNVAEDELEAVTQEILEMIVTLYADTKIAYYECLFAQKTYELVLGAAQQARELADWIAYRYEFGYETKLELYLAQVEVKNWLSRSFVYQAELHNAFTQLTKILGVSIDKTPFILTDSIEHEELAIDSVQTLEALAYKNRPEIHVQRMKLQQARHNISLQRALAFKDVRAGISYKLDFERQRGTGPSIGLEIPVFDWNQAHIQKAKVQTKMQELILLQTQREVQAEVQMHYQSYIAGLKEIELHDEALQLYKRALAFVKEQAEKMMFSRSTLWQTTIDFLQERIDYMKKHLEAHKHFALLEKAIGKKLVHNETT